MLYQIVTGEIREGDLRQRLLGESKLSPVEKMYVGRLASEILFPIFRPVKVPSLDETNDARLKLCRDDSICDASDCCSDCMYKTMLRLMGLEPEQAKE